MIYDINNRFPRAYVHRHKLHQRTAPFKAMGPSEVTMLVAQLDSLIIGPSAQGPTTTLKNPTTGVNTVYQQKVIYTKPPHITADNFFTSDAIMDWLGGKKYGMTGTCARNHIPPPIKPYTHHGKVDATHRKCKAMRFENPVVAINQCKASDTTHSYTKTFVSFQSTGGTNIIGVNNLPSCQLYVNPKSRGRKDNKRLWGTEGNEGRSTYLGHYYGLDNADHMIKNTGNQFISWKYWHSPYRHAISLGIIAAYDIYIECCRGLLDPDWFVEVKKRMKYQQFRMQLAKQMLRYDPSDGHYPGDETFRAFTQKHKSRRGSSENKGEGGRKQSVRKGDNTTFEKYQAAVEKGRLCMSAEDIASHFTHINRTTNGAPCVVCGKNSIWKCDKCGVSVCIMEKRKWNGAKCSFLYHNPVFFGLARNDHTGGGQWQPPTPQMLEKNARKINRWRSGEEATDIPIG